MNRFRGAGPKPGCSILDRLGTDMAAVFSGNVDADADAIARGLGALPVQSELPWDTDEDDQP